MVDCLHVKMANFYRGLTAFRCYYSSRTNDASLPLHFQIGRGMPHKHQWDLHRNWGCIKENVSVGGVCSIVQRHV